MILDSHAHYSHNTFGKTFRYLTRTPEGYALADGTREDLFREMEATGIAGSIEPAISLESNEAVLALCSACPGRVFPAVGLHPTRTGQVPWKDRKKLAHYASDPRVIAIGETGLDYHYARKDQHRLRQKMWFLWQLELARKRKLPVILHVRDAHPDALRILKLHPARKPGGVIHCFNRDWETARAYLALGYHVGLGGAVLQPEDRGRELWEAVRKIPLDRILVETDSPYKPDSPYDLPVPLPKRNTSLILPEVIRKIAELKQLPPEEVERAVAENTIRLFSLTGMDAGGSV